MSFIRTIPVSIKEELPQYICNKKNGTIIPILVKEYDKKDLYNDVKKIDNLASFFLSVFDAIFVLILQVFFEIIAMTFQAMATWLEDYRKARGYKRD